MCLRIFRNCNAHMSIFAENHHAVMDLTRKHKMAFELDRKFYVFSQNTTFHDLRIIPSYVADSVSNSDAVSTLCSEASKFLEVAMSRKCV